MRLCPLLDLGGVEQRQQGIEMTGKGTARNVGAADLKLASKTWPVVLPTPLKKRAVLVLGMHRSGTSAVARLLSLLGADLPSTLLPPAPDNPLGFWEAPNIVDIHNELLASAGSSWDDVAAIPRTWFDSDRAKSFQDRVVQILKADFAGSPLFVIKDPRICRLVPFWGRVLDKFGCEPHYVISVRNPLEVAASLKARDGFLPAKSLLLWLRHLLEAEQATRGQRRSFVCYERLLRNWRETAATISANLEISWPRASHEAAVEIEMFLSESARQHSFSAAELDNRSDIVDWVKRTYATILATDEGTARMEKVLDNIRKRLDAADQAFGPLLAEARLNLRHKSERAQLLHRTVTEREEDLNKRGIEMQQLSADLATRDTEIRQLQQRDGASGQEIEALRHQAAARDGEAEAQARRIDELTSHLGSANQKVAAGQADLGRLSTELVSREAEAEELREKIHSSSQEVERLHHEVLARDAEIESQARKIHSSSQEVERLHHEVAARDTESESQAREIETLDSEANLARRRVAELQGEVTSLRGSKSWQVTKPLRGLADRLMRRERLWGVLLSCYKLAAGTSRPSPRVER